MKKGLVSIILPVYKAERYLKECLESLVSQTYTQLEIICVNDGSPDGCMDILKSYREKDKRIFIIDKHNEGVSAARNDALKIARGQYTAFVDADDWIEPNTINFAVRAIRKMQADVVMWSYVSERETNLSVKHIFQGNRCFENIDIRKKLHRRFIGLLGEELLHPELADSLSPVWGKLYKTSMLSGIRFIDLAEIGTYEDGLFNLEYYRNVKKAIYIDRPFYHYRRFNSSSLTATYRPDLFMRWQSLFDRMETYISENDFDEDYLEALNNRIALSIIGLGLNICASNMTAVSKILEVRKVIRQERYRHAVTGLKLQWFSIPWKIFFFSARQGWSVSLYFLLQMIRLLRKRT